MRTHPRAPAGAPDAASRPTLSLALPAAARQRAARLPLRWRLALGYALVLLLVLAPLAALQAVAIHGLLYKDASTALTAAAQAAGTAPGKAAKHTSATTQPGAALSADEVAQRAAHQQSVPTDVLVVDASGRVLGSSTPSGGEVADAARLVDAARVRQALTHPADILPPYTQGPYLVAIARPAPAPRGPGKGAAAPAGPDNAPSREVLVLARSLAPIDRVTTYVWTLTMAGTALALLLATVLGALLVRRALRPLARVAGAADAMAAGDYARRVAVSPARDEVGHLAVAFNTMATAVEDAFATQRRFVADAAHVLRTPLTALGGYADVLLLGAATDPDDLATALEAMRGETQRMARLVNDLLALARLDAGAFAIQPARLDLAAVLRDAYTGARLLHPDRHLTLDLAAAPLPVHGDTDRLRQVVGNVLDNAVKFTDPGGYIALALRRDGRDALLEVRDDGVGISPEDLPHVRERFYRADKARARATGGMGLGLAIVQAIVAAHGGRVDIASRPGQGTTVAVRVPLASDVAGFTPPSVAPLAVIENT